MADTIYETEMRIKSLIDTMDKYLPEKYLLKEEELKAIRILCQIPDNTDSSEEEEDGVEQALKAMYIWGFGRGLAAANDQEMKTE